MKQKYLMKVKERFIKEYLKSNGVVPNATEINQYLIEFKKENPEIETYGMSGAFLQKYSFLEASSATKENQNLELIKEDIEIQEEYLKSNMSRIDTSVYNFKSFLKRSMNKLNLFESRLNSLIINYSNSDLFLHSIEEEFNNHDNVDLEKTTLDVMNGYATLKSKPEYFGLETASASFKYRTKNTLISSGANNKVKEILVQNGKEWVGSCITRESSGRVVLEIEIDLKEKVDIGSIVIDGRPMEVNSKTYYGIEVAESNKSYRAIQPRIKRFSVGENFTNLNERKISKIRISLIKENSDEKMNGSYRYIFNINSIKIRKDFFKTNEEGVLYAGPYEVKDNFGNPINFSMAKLSTDTCCIVPDKTSVNFYLSKDNVNWKEAFFEEGYQNVIKFNDVNIASQGTEIDINENKFSIIKIDKDFYLNFKIKTEAIKGINKNNIILKRNISQNSTLYKGDQGWYFDTEDETYNITIEVEKIEGRYIDLGYTSATIDGFEKTGLIKLEKGFHTIKTSSANYLKVTSYLESLEELEEEDKLYPYNHKYLFEGYSYPQSFQGEKNYFGFNNRFSFLLSYIPEEKFDIYNDLSIYTMIEKEDYTYFKVNVNLIDYSWKKEINNVIIYGSEDLNNIFYVKAIVRSSDTGRAPHINSLVVRVI